MTTRDTRFFTQDERTGYITYKFDAIRDAVDLPSLVRRYQSRMTGSTTEYRCACPLHGGDHPRGLAIYVDRRANCWKYKCNTGCSEGEGQGDCFDFIQHKERLPSNLAAAAWLVDNWLTGERPAIVMPTRPEAPPVMHPSAAHECAARIDLAVPPTGLLTARQWWHRQGFNDQTITRFFLGFTPNRLSEDGRSFFDPCMTIPVWHGEDLATIRCRRLLSDDDADKYRPLEPGHGAALFNRNSIALTPDHAPREYPAVLIFEGEKKAMMACQLGLDAMFGCVSATTGSKAWTGQWGEVWRDEHFTDVEAVYVVLDPDTYRSGKAERTAKLFGRRGHTIRLPMKFDDWMLHLGPDRGLVEFFNVMGNTVPTRNVRYWQEQMAQGELHGRANRTLATPYATR
jgi:hypothetical protein